MRAIQNKISQVQVQSGDPVCKSAAIDVHVSREPGEKSSVTQRDFYRQEP